MTKTQIYKAISEYVKTLDDGEQTFINREVEAEHKYNGMGLPATILIDLLIGLKSDIRAECAKANGSTNALKSALDIIKAAKKKPQTALHGAWMVDEKQCVCDGCRAIRFNEHLDLPVIPKDSQPMNVLSIFNGAKQNENEYPLPTIGELKAHIALEKAKPRTKAEKKRGIEYDIGEAYPLVDAEYLLTMIAGIENCKAYCGSTVLNIMYFSGDNGDGILCPIRRKDKQNDEAETA